MSALTFLLTIVPLVTAQECSDSSVGKCQASGTPAPTLSLMEEKEMFDEIWTKYSEQTDVVAKGITKDGLLRSYFDTPGKSIKSDYLRIFAKAEKQPTPAEARIEPAEQPAAVDILSFDGSAAPTPSLMEEKEMFDEIWTKYSEQTDVVAKGITKDGLLRSYYETPGKSIKSDYLRILAKFEEQPGLTEARFEPAEQPAAVDILSFAGSVGICSFVIMITELVRKGSRKKS